MILLNPKGALRWLRLDKARTEGMGCRVSLEKKDGMTNQWRGSISNRTDVPIVKFFFLLSSQSFWVTTSLPHLSTSSGMMTDGGSFVLGQNLDGPALRPIALSSTQPGPGPSGMSVLPLISVRSSAVREEATGSLKLYNNKELIASINYI